MITESKKFESPSKIHKEIFELEKRLAEKKRELIKKEIERPDKEIIKEIIKERVELPGAPKIKPVVVLPPRIVRITKKIKTEPKKKDK